MKTEIMHLVRNYVIRVESKSDFSTTNGLNRGRSMTVAFHRGRSALHFLFKIVLKNINKYLLYWFVTHC